MERNKIDYLLDIICSPEVVKNVGSCCFGHLFRALLDLLGSSTFLAWPTKHCPRENTSTLAVTEAWFLCRQCYYGKIYHGAKRICRTVENVSGVLGRSLV